MSNKMQAKVNATLILIAITCAALALVLAIPVSLPVHILSVTLILVPNLKVAAYVWSK